MTAENLPSPELLRKLLRYEPATGKLFWRERAPDLFTGAKKSVGSECKRWNSRYAGREAFTALQKDGYRHGCIFGRLYLAHRVIWAIVHGEWPAEVDHKEGVRDDNRLHNLRAVTHVENSKNRKRQSNNTSGVVGAIWCKRNRKWWARITVDGKRKHIGYFENFDEAVAARKAAEAEHGYHPNHGRD